MTRIINNKSDSQKIKMIILQTVRNQTNKYKKIFSLNSCNKRRAELLNTLRMKRTPSFLLRTKKKRKKAKWNTLIARTWLKSSKTIYSLRRIQNKIIYQKNQRKTFLNTINTQKTPIYPKIKTTSQISLLNNKMKEIFKEMRKIGTIDLIKMRKIFSSKILWMMRLNENYWIIEPY